jgi:hypothetical protein
MKYKCPFCTSTCSRPNKCRRTTNAAGFLSPRLQLRSSRRLASPHPIIYLPLPPDIYLPPLHKHLSSPFTGSRYHSYLATFYPESILPTKRIARENPQRRLKQQPPPPDTRDKAHLPAQGYTQTSSAATDSAGRLSKVTADITCISSCAVEDGGWRGTYK